MRADEIIDLVAKTMRKSSLPSKNGAHVPDRYQASVHAEDMGHALEKAGLVEVWHHFYNKAMPPKDCAETWNDL